MTLNYPGRSVFGGFSLGPGHGAQGHGESRTTERLTSLMSLPSPGPRRETDLLQRAWLYVCV